MRPDGTLSFTWIRRARIGGDNWDGEPPLSEETEAYRLTLLNAGAPIRTYQVSSPAADYPPADQAADFPAGVPGAIAVQVQQLSAVFGWGAPIQRTL